MMETGGDRDAERFTLSACLQSPAARKEALRHLTGGDFFYPDHQTIFDTMSRLDRDKVHVDAGTVMGALPAKVKGSLVEITTVHALPDSVAHYATTVRNWATRRNVHSQALQVLHSAENPDVDPTGLAGAAAARFAAVRDRNANDIQSITLGELLAQPDDTPEWVVPDLLERRDRLILTGGEGLGKSTLLRQIAVMAAAGVDPFTYTTQIPPQRVLIIDCENREKQIKRRVRQVVQFAKRFNGGGEPDNVNLLCCGRIDIMRDKDLAMLHREVEPIQPDIIVIGPLYALAPRALNTDDEAVPVLAALDGLREGGAALLTEAHAGHSTGPEGRNFRPRGSSALLGWPEFGYGLKPVASGIADMVPWRGDRDRRVWPQRLRWDRGGIRWIDHNGPPTLEAPEFQRKPHWSNYQQGEPA